MSKKLTSLEFEKPVRELENQIEELIETSNDKGFNLKSEIEVLQNKVNELLKDIYSKLSSWDRVQLARHPMRPHTSDFINSMVDDFHEIHGDRKFADDSAMICGFGYLDGLKVAIVGIEKGRKTKDKIKRNFGMPRPEGYRKALRVMQMASRFNIPIISLIDTPGAYPGIGAEERGQSQAIAENLAELFDIKSPMISAVIGEGGSGGALGIGISDTILMLQYSIYSVISPESCASILWSNPGQAQVAANALDIGPNKALALDIIDRIVDEPIGGAHRDPKTAAQYLKKELVLELKKLSKMDNEKMLEARFEKFRNMGNSTLIYETSKDN